MGQLQRVVFALGRRVAGGNRWRKRAGLCGCGEGSRLSYMAVLLDCTQHDAHTSPPISSSPALEHNKHRPLTEVSACAPTWCGLTDTPSLMARTASAATAALLCPTCRLRNRNWRLRLEVSMVSRSICRVAQAQVRSHRKCEPSNCIQVGVCHLASIGSQKQEGNRGFCFEENDRRLRCIDTQ